MTASVDGIVAQLPNMTPSDLLKVRQLTDMLLGKGNETKPANPFEQILFDAVRTELANVGIRQAIGYGSFTETKHYKSWRKNLGTVSEFIEEAFKGYTNTEVQRIAICRILIKTMIRDFKMNGIPVSLGSIANNIHRIPQTFDRAFPGYLSSGLAYLVPRAMLKETN